jgi:hypothetical protein
MLIERGEEPYASTLEPSYEARGDGAFSSLPSDCTVEVDLRDTVLVSFFLPPALDNLVDYISHHKIY